MNIEGSGQDWPSGGSETSTGAAPEASPEPAGREAAPEGSFEPAPSPEQAVLPPAQELRPTQSIMLGSSTAPPEGAEPTAATYTPPAAYPPPSAYPAGPGFGPPLGYGQPPYPPQAAYPPAQGYVPPGYPPPPGFGQPPPFGPYGPQPPIGYLGYGQPGIPPGGGPGYGQPGFGYGSPSWPGMLAPAGPAPGLVWAGMGIRLAALVIDMVIELIVLVAGTAIADAVGFQAYGPNAGYSPVATVILWITLGLLVAYIPTCWWAFEGTIGQRAFGLRVLRAADGLSLRAGATTIRYLIWLLCVLTVVIGLVVAVVASEKPDKRAWLDDASGSVVVRRA
ncbi:MAG: RDD family protein [Candidatus Limnocylindrales bacterium]